MNWEQSHSSDDPCIGPWGPALVSSLICCVGFAFQVALRPLSPEASVLEMSLNELPGSSTEAGVGVSTLGGGAPSLLTVNSFPASSVNSDLLLLCEAWGRCVSWGEAD